MPDTPGSAAADGGAAFPLSARLDAMIGHDSEGEHPFVTAARWLESEVARLTRSLAAARAECDAARAWRDKYADREGSNMVMKVGTTTFTAPTVAMVCRLAACRSALAAGTDGMQTNKETSCK